MLNVYGGNECVIHNGIASGSIAWINYRGSSGTGIAGYYFGKGLSTLDLSEVHASTFIGNLTGTASSADTLDGYHADTSSTGGAWSFIPTVKSDGTMGVGRYIDFHHVSNDGSDYKARLHTDGSTDGQLFINGNKI